MISRTAANCQMPDWRTEMAQSISDPEHLLNTLDLPISLLPAARAAAQTFGLRVPYSYVALMERGNPADPLLRQILPIDEELREIEGFVDDPVGDGQAAKGNGLLTKYQGRSLIIASPACAVNCRYCFRRAFPYGEQIASRKHWHELLHTLRHEKETHEVILSGGDPLALDDGKLAELISKLDDIPHLRRLRIHSRLPVVIPRRVTPALVDILQTSRLRIALVMHFNHPREISQQVHEHFSPLKQAGTLLNQSVLLKGVNDHEDTLSQLSENLFDSGVLPYYIHLLDRVRGAAHFDVSESTARNLIRKLRCRLPGYLIPRLVKEIKGEPAKTLLA